MTSPHIPREQVDYAYLLAWLRDATEGLSDDARARIREEITDHFHQALDDGIDAGLSHDAAARKAVDELGSPVAARRAFKRTYLSRWQGYLLRRLIEPPRFRSPETSVILPAALISYWDPRHERHMRPFVVGMLTVLTALQFAIFGPLSALGISLIGLMGIAALVFKFAVPDLAHRGRQRDAVALGAGAELCFAVGWILSRELSGSHPLGLSLWIAGTVVALVLLAYLPLVAKLSNQPCS